MFPPPPRFCSAPPLPRALCHALRLASSTLQDACCDGIVCTQCKRFRGVNDAVEIRASPWLAFEMYNLSIMPGNSILQLYVLTASICLQTFFAGKPAICGALSTLLRTANTFLGSLMWVDFIDEECLNLPQPAILWPVELWTGKQIISLLIPRATSVISYKCKQVGFVRDTNVIIQKG